MNGSDRWVMLKAWAAYRRRLPYHHGRESGCAACHLLLCEMNASRFDKIVMLAFGLRISKERSVP